MKLTTSPRRWTALTGAGIAAALALTGCSSTPEAEEAPASSITVATNNGDVEVPVEPVRVAALDSTAFETLLAFGIEPVVAPKPLLPSTGFEAWADDAEILDAGSHREPNLEAVSEAAPDLIIGGYRFADYTEDLSKIATTIDIAPGDESEGGYVEGLKAQTLALGKIFDKEEEAEKLVADLEKSTKAAADATNGESVFLASTSVGRVDNAAGRLTRIIEPLDLKDVFAVESGELDETAHHTDQGLAPETVAQANPDWVIVFDRDAATSDEDFTPAQQIFESQAAWAQTTFTTDDQVIYLEPNFYITEGIHAYTRAFDQISAKFAA
ncbi:ABC transporter substrate-binding protein [Oerskovia sp. KBS0722]|uniref:ABC transporter substrate-binding protein n=1 Tax=Oerskovia sp. KBS0722 TaxID=1179673 RepID=UPI00110EBB4E|nr:ABC transporter substrate-binding protein [Oerskovia sp. KBS0722]QDW61906.1 ABC transporter substrate-binding protein [Oerskovia sp. KBS0722]